MRPYIAVIKDSFREALASRVLWILLILTTVILLVVLAPLGIKERLRSTLQPSDIVNWSQFVAQLKAEAASDSPAPGKRIWALLSDSMKQEIEARSDQVEPATDSVAPPNATGELNAILARRDFYDEAAWRDVRSGGEVAGLLQRGLTQLSDEQVTRLNRLLLEAAYPEAFAPSRQNELHVTYLGWNLAGPLPLEFGQVLPMVRGILAGFMSFFVGTIAVFAGILVTAPIIPHTFEGGAIDLLLSKPVSRSMLFLAKFLGGCAFILLNAAYFIVGLWLIVGLRFDLWSGKLLLCIPIFLFLFAIYYSVSALAGVLWRNAIVSVVVSILFWGACFLVGTTKNSIEIFFVNPGRIVKLVEAGNTLLGVSEGGLVEEWREDGRKWQRVFLSDNEPAARGPMGFSPPLIGPVYDARGDRLLAIRQTWPGLPGMSRQATLSLANRSEEWKRIEGPHVPPETASLFVGSEGETIVVAKSGVFRLQGNPTAKPGQINLFGLKLPLAGATFVSVGPDPPARWTSPLAAAFDASTASVAVWHHGGITLLEPNKSGRYTQQVERNIETDSAAAALAFGGSTLVVALADGRIHVVQAADLRIEREYRPEGTSEPRFVSVSPDGRWFSVLFHHGKLWLFDAEHMQPISQRISGQGDISAAAFGGPNRLLVADRATRVTEYQLDPFQAQRRLVPDMGVLERVYRYAIMPIYTLFPKPGEIDNVVNYLLTDRRTVAAGGNEEELSATRFKLNIWGPIWSSLAFMLVMLAVTCLYIRRADF